MKKTIKIKGLKVGDDILKISCKSNTGKITNVEIPIKVIGLPKGRLTFQIEFQYVNAAGNRNIFKLLSTSGSLAGKENNLTCYMCDSNFYILKTHVFDYGDHNISGGYTFANDLTKYMCSTIPSDKYFRNTNYFSEGFLVPKNTKYFIIV